MEKSNQQRIITALILAASGGSLAWGSGADAPFASSNRNPFVQIYGLPSAQSAILMKEGSFSSGLQLDFVSSFSEDDNASESVFIDGETHRANIQLRYAMSNHLELGLDIPWLSHDGGGLDSLIDDWHDFWGLPDGGRPKHPSDQLLYRYQRNGTTLAEVSQSGDGLGDISLSLGYQLAGSTHRQWALRSALKMPTGDADSLQGSESTDLSLGLHVSDQSWLQSHGISLHGSAGLLWMSGGEVLDQLREDWVVYGSTTMSWRASTRVRLKLQLDAHTAFYDSELTELGNNSAQLILGGAIQLTDKWVLDLAVSEDIAVDTAPDVVFHVSLKAMRW